MAGLMDSECDSGAATDLPPSAKANGNPIRRPSIILGPSLIRFSQTEACTTVMRVTLTSQPVRSPALATHRLRILAHACKRAWVSSGLRLVSSTPYLCSVAASSYHRST